LAENREKFGGNETEVSQCGTRLQFFLFSSYCAGDCSMTINSGGSLSSSDVPKVIMGNQSSRDGTYLLGFRAAGTSAARVRRKKRVACSTVDACRPMRTHVANTIEPQFKSPDVVGDVHESSPVLASKVGSLDLKNEVPTASLDDKLPSNEVSVLSAVFVPRKSKGAKT
jgi:hypothetical protein